MNDDLQADVKEYDEYDQAMNQGLIALWRKVTIKYGVYAVAYGLLLSVLHYRYGYIPTFLTVVNGLALLGLFIFNARRWLMAKGKDTDDLERRENRTFLS